MTSAWAQRHEELRVCPTFYTWSFSPGCAAHDAHRDPQTPCCNAQPVLLGSLQASPIGQEVERMPGRYVRLFVHAPTMLLSSPPRILVRLQAFIWG